ncbi:MAG: hypothetical protein EZS28_034496, partial [Streblomastix strix]
SDQFYAYIKGEGIVLLLLKADKTQLIIAYTKGQAYKHLNIKIDSLVSYIKQKNDALLLLNADKIQLIDESTKGEDDALWLLMADKRQLIDANIQGQTDNLKQEDDALLLLKADKQELADAHSKTEDDEIEDDALLDDKLNITDQIDAIFDMNRMHYICGVTDSMSWEKSGNLDIEEDY